MMRNFSIDIVWAKVQMAFTVIGGWIGYFVGGVDEPHLAAVEARWQDLGLIVEADLQRVGGVSARPTDEVQLHLIAHLRPPSG